MGRTITKGHEILTKDLAKDATNDIAIIEFGGNDCDFNWAEVAENPANSNTFLAHQLTFLKHNFSK